MLKSSHPKIVTLGGGSGLFSLLRGLKYFPVDMTAVVTIADDGGSSGRLRQEFEMPPPGDIRNVLVALSEAEPLVKALLQYRFQSENTGLNGHPVGNLILAAMNEITGDFHSAITALCQVFNVKGKILPATREAPKLLAELQNGQIIEGESQIGKTPSPILRVYHDKCHATHPEVIRAIQTADAIILGPGSLFTSIIPNLIVPDIAKALLDTSAKKFYVANIMMQAEETRGYSTNDHVAAIEQHLGQVHFFDAIFVNDKPVPPHLLQAYAALEKTGVSPIDEVALAQTGVQIIRAPLIDEKASYVRHDALKLAATLFAHLVV